MPILSDEQKKSIEDAKSAVKESKSIETAVKKGAPEIQFSTELSRLSAALEEHEKNIQTCITSLQTDISKSFMSYLYEEAQNNLGFGSVGKALISSVPNLAMVAVAGYLLHISGNLSQMETSLVNEQQTVLGQSRNSTSTDEYQAQLANIQVGLDSVVSTVANNVTIAISAISGAGVMIKDAISAAYNKYSEKEAMPKELTELNKLLQDVKDARQVVSKGFTAAISEHERHIKQEDKVAHLVLNMPKTDDEILKAMKEMQQKVEAIGDKLPKVEQLEQINALQTQLLEAHSQLQILSTEHEDLIKADKKLNSAHRVLQSAYEQTSKRVTESHQGILKRTNSEPNIHFNQV